MCACVWTYEYKNPNQVLKKLDGVLCLYFRTASIAIGNLSSCDSTHLQQLANVAVQTDAYGPVAGWDASTFSSIGIVLGSSLSGYSSHH